MIKAEIELEHWNGEQVPYPNKLRLTNSEDSFVWVAVEIDGILYSVRVDVNQLEQAVRAIKAGKD